MNGGIVLIDKPKEWSSFDVVNKIRRMAGDAGLNITQRKRYPVGHTGTLDPLATGLLVVLLGAYTKQALSMSKANKLYQVTACLGKTSSTDDAEGSLIDVSDSVPTVQEVNEALISFVGNSLQKPPAFSAIKVNGQRAYKLARAGQELKLEARPINIYKIEAIRYDYPSVSFTVAVSSGTYVRSLVRDLGVLLHTGAYMSDLRRLKVGEYDIKDAVQIGELTAENLSDYLFTPAS